MGEKYKNARRKKSTVAINAKELNTHCCLTLGQLQFGFVTWGFSSLTGVALMQMSMFLFSLVLFQKGYCRQMHL